MAHDVLTGGVMAELPSQAIARLARDPRVATVEVLRPERALGLDLSSAAVGAPSLWAAGYGGGRGAADSLPVDLAILHDKIEEEHPAFAGIRFQRPADAPVGTSCGQRINGCEHGTEVASMAISRGAIACEICTSADSAKRGVAPELDSVLDAQASAIDVDDVAWALGIDQPGTPGAVDPAEVMSSSHGSPASLDDSAALQGVDKLISAFGTLIAYPAGNEGPGRTVNRSCVAYDTLCMGGFSPRGTVDPADDVVEDFSSRGPTPGGRKKPDLVAVSTSEFANQHWIRDGRLWSGGSGTSLAAPQGAAGAALLAGSGIAAPIAQKAILINSARQGRATPTSAMGTQSGWQPDWGWGALDLDAALKERTHFHLADIAGGDAHFYRATVEAPGDRATLVWNRRALGCIAPGCDTTALTLSNLELEQLDAATGSRRAISASTIDNVEQVRSPAGGDAIYKVKAASTVDGLPGEPYAITARRPLTRLVSPRPRTRVSLSSASARRGEIVHVVAEVSNPSPDLAGEGATTTLALPPGMELAPGSGPVVQPLGTLGPGQTRVVSWAVRANEDLTSRIEARSSTARYGETFASSDGVAFTADTTPPAVTIASPAGRTGDTTLGVAWSGNDAGVGLADYDVEVSANDTPFAPWLSATTSTGATYAAARGARYRFRVRARDRLGNASEYVVSSEVAVAESPPDPSIVTPQPPAAKSSPALRIRSIMRRGSRITIRGTLERSAYRALTFDLRATANGRRIRRRLERFPQSGRFKLSLRAPRPLTGTLTVRYAGDERLDDAAARARLRGL